jgi:hypothetical protein
LKIRKYQVKKTKEAMVEAFSDLNLNMQLIAANLDSLLFLILDKAELTTKSFSEVRLKIDNIQSQANETKSWVGEV